MNAPPPPHAAILACLTTALVACSGKPFTLERAGSDASLPDAASETAAPDEARASDAQAHVSATPLRSPATRLAAQAAVEPVVEVGFAAHTSGTLAAFDAKSGSVLGLIQLSGSIEDVAWDGRTRRVLVVTREPETDGCRLHALEWNAGFVEHAVSEPLDGVARAFALGTALLVAAREIGTSWTLLDDALVAVAPSHAWLHPSGFLPLASRSALVLDWRAAGTETDRVARVDFATTPWSAVSDDVAAEGRPSSRLGRAADGAWLLRLEASGHLSLARIAAPSGSFVPPSFVVHELQAVEATIEGVAWEPAHAAFVVSIARGPGGSEPGALVLIPTEPSQTPTLVPLDGAVEAATWLSRSLERDSNGRILVATSAGIVAFAVAGAPGSASLLGDATFLAPALRAPMALAMDTSREALAEAAEP